MAQRKQATVAVPGFEAAHKTEFRRLIVSVEGTEKDGKSHFALTAPDPIAYISMDVGTEGVVDKFVDTKRIVVADFDYKDATNADEWREMWGKVKKAHYDALAAPTIKTVVWDTETEMWELARLARFGKLTEVMPHQYGIVNAEFRDMIRRAYGTTKNLILLHKMKEKYVNNASTGKLTRAGFNGTEYLVQLNLKSWRDKKSLEFAITVLNCRQNEKMVGMEYVDPLNTFPMIAAEVFPDTTPEQWE